MSKTKTTCNCGCNVSGKVLAVTQLENQTVLAPENLENRDKILVLSKNINNAYMVKVMSTLTVKDLVRAIEDSDVAFLLTEMKEPAVPDTPGTTEPGTTPTEPGTSGDTTGDTQTEGETGNA